MGSIKIDYEAVQGSLAKLRALSNSTALLEAHKSVESAKPTHCSGASYDAVKSYSDDLALINKSLANLLEQTIATVESAELYFTMTDQEIRAYISQLNSK
ncbi:MAG: hypothetical protein FWE41_07960 [Coriobacteriia bacterium]|nr:hypothetical protein [Coriobacteriia bacterium]